MAQIIDGKKIAHEILEQLKSDVAAFPFKPRLIDVFVGENPVIESYVNIKSKRAAEIGVDFVAAKFPEDISEERLCQEIQQLQQDAHVCGLIVQLPLPEHLDKQRVLDAINPEIDVDVTTSTNLGRLFTGTQQLTPATAGAIMHMLDAEAVTLEGARVLVVGSGDLVGKPVAFLLMQRRATVTVANAATKNLAELGTQSDVIISGTGVPNLITSGMVREGAVIIDAGTAESGSGITGDVDFEAVSGKASKVSPVPGGVGPVTVAMLLKNVVQVAQARVH